MWHFLSLAELPRLQAPHQHLLAHLQDQHPLPEWHRCPWLSVQSPTQPLHFHSPGGETKRMICEYISIYIYIYIYIYLKADHVKKKIIIHIYTVLCKSLRSLVFSPTKNGFKSVISIFCSSVSVGNISLHFQTLFLSLIVIMQWDYCLHKESDNSQCSTQRSDLIHIQSVWNDMK